MNTLTENQANKLEGLLNLSEISLTLKSMKSGKSPGLSGFSADFFKDITRAEVDGTPSQIPAF